MIAARKMDQLAEAAKEIEQELPSPHSNRVVPVQCNIREDAEVKKLFETTKSLFQDRPLSLLCNNAGGQFPSPAGLISLNGWKSVVDLNLNSTFNMCLNAYKSSMFEHGGSIVNIVAEVRSGFPGMAHTGAARAGVINLTQSLAVEWAPRGVRVNCVSPGVIMHESALAHYERAGAKDWMTNYKDKIPARRLGTVEEVASAVVFLMSPAAQFITGVNLPVDGGQCLTPGTPPAGIFDEHDGWKPYRGGSKF